MKLIWQSSFLILMLAGCSLENNDNLPNSDNSLLKVEPAAIESENSDLQGDIIDDLLIKLSDFRAEQIKGEEAKSVFSGSLSFCTNFVNYEPHIIEDNSWWILEDDKLISTAREFKFSDRQQADSFAVEAKKWAEMFYTLPRSTWNRNNVNCWPNHTDKFYAVIHNGDNVMLIGDGDQYNYWFEAGDGIRDFHVRNNTDFYRFLITMKNQK
ncbi:hypothetical protein [Psychrobacter lutiphocae]|uniref:hypothetical protein n=1 Tax=Psychrobacter lutiphocae TaxID=540500 RepID=UPI0003636137|nr:hypothetical protein [Psychrobacter lutiphocae]